MGTETGMGHACFFSTGRIHQKPLTAVEPLSSELLQKYYPSGLELLQQCLI